MEIYIKFVVAMDETGDVGKDHDAGLELEEMLKSYVHDNNEDAASWLANNVLDLKVCCSHPHSEAGNQ